MGFFSKGEKKGKNEKDHLDNSLPDLPDLPMDFPNKNINTNKNSNLPTLPNSNIGNKLNQDTVKEAVSQGKQNREPLDFPAMHTASPPEKLPPIASYPPRPIQSPRSMEMSQMDYDLPQQETMAQPLFIKLDTFEKAISSFNEIKLRISEIDSLLKNIKDIKNREEAELTEWEREIEEIKSRLEQINHDIFDKIE